jgi:drug/metabolite transporter (DMT)-like permease
MTTPTVAPAAASNARGIAFMIVTMFVFSTQDGITRLLGAEYPPIFIVMIRYWAFALFVIAFAATQPGGVIAAARTRHPILQISRGLLLSTQICFVTFSFTYLGLGATHAIMAVTPLMVAAAGALILGETVRLAQWLAIGTGFVGVLVLLTPSGDVFDPWALLPLLCAVMFATYSILTRWVATHDRPQTAFFYTGIGGALGMTLVGPFYWTPMASHHWAWMAALCVTGALGHFLLIKAYEHAEASSLQPFAYLQLALVSIIGAVIFGETIDTPFLIGTSIIVGAGLFAWSVSRFGRRRTDKSKRDV